MAAMVVLLLLGLLQLAVPGLAQSPPPGTVTMESFTYSGSGCPPGSFLGAVSSDGMTFTGLLNNHTAFTPGSPDDQVKKCQVAVRLTYPTGFVFALETVTFQGYAQFQEGVQCSLEAGSFFSGIPGTVRTLRYLPPPVDDNFQFTDAFATFLYAPCGSDSMTLNVYSEVRVVPPPPPRNFSSGFIDIASQDFHLRWKTC
ncbi:hypothetical protein CBR_g49164 [Chara braunii]|uniref:DUF4360 domain-containing protein n=1 Tax=Chara braunii TaxID=69332 RepID=A0A388M4H3_CHABU|nr:hypothetical protein CBR_g49164 [Chara braunii]|eukprot:GBG89373.1 hypothetical protein CBR_g49164 [Chara braunii]